jgi:2-polyprenyl-3-methyl-5-hydroxy-6-metoxy-1,4-benzoquinol methylase
VFSLEEARRRGLRRDEAGRWFKTAPRGDYADESVARLEAEGRIHRTASGNVRVKYFLEERGGMVIEEVLVGDVWNDIPDAMHLGSERIGWPTQKPLALAERIIKAASNPGDIVLDAFCGSGTTLVAAARLGRRWIGIDTSEQACTIARERLAAVRA